MSTSNPELPPPASSPTLQLPQGWQIGVGRETGQTQPTGAVVQGLAYTLTSPTGTATTVFIPYSMITNIPAIQGIVDTRIQAIQAISG